MLSHFGLKITLTAKLLPWLIAGMARMVPPALKYDVYVRYYNMVAQNFDLTASKYPHSIPMPKDAQGFTSMTTISAVPLIILKSNS